MTIGSSHKTDPSQCLHWQYATTPSATTRDCQDFCCIVVMTRELHPVGNITFVIQTHFSEERKQSKHRPIYSWSPPNSPQISQFSNSVLLQINTDRKKISH